MRLRERDKKTVYLRRRTGTTQNEHLDTIVAWGQAVTIRAAHHPAGGMLEAQMYGERLRGMRTLYYDGPEVIQEADGLCLYVEAGEVPDYKVVSVQGWDGHAAIQAEFVPPERRNIP